MTEQAIQAHMIQTLCNMQSVIENFYHASTRTPDEVHDEVREIAIRELEKQQ